MDSVAVCRGDSGSSIGCKYGLRSGKMEFNPAKSQVVHSGRSNMLAEYNFNGKTLGSLVDHRDLGVRV